jgi:hypothetical protein
MDFETAKDACKLKNANCKLWAKAYEFRRVVCNISENVGWDISDEGRSGTV